MILFYSEYCQHCKILLETIKKHDKNNTIKLISIDILRSLKKPIDPKIHSVPALMIVNTKEYLFGKAVFDYLLLPNRGVLFSCNSTREDKNLKDIKTDMNQQTKASNDVVGEPSAFSLGAISAETFSSINDELNMMHDKNYIWDTIDGSTSTPHIDVNSSVQTDESDKKKKLPSVEELMKQRANDII